MPFTILPDQPQYIGTTVTQGGSTEVSGLSAAALNADLLPAMDVSAYKWISVHLTSAASSGTLSFQCSNDNVNWLSLPLQGISSTINAAQSSAALSGSVNNMFIGPINFRYMRLRLSSYASGSIQGVVELYTYSTALNTLGIAASQIGTWNMLSVAGEAHIGQVGGLTPLISATFVRPSNVTAYAANSVVTVTANGALAIAGASRATGKTGSILSVTLIDAVNSLTPLQPVIWLFSALPTSLADGATLALSLADAQAKIGVIPLYQTWLDNSSASPSGIRTFFASVPPMAFLPASGTTIYAYIVSSAAYTPVSAESFTLILGIAQD